ncbi:hypothetical protein [Mesorhizobium sp.]|uniref:hypothetical protein n=1 Tax=Mesorhizobium sp. TaxID=1871066 RepID=UPI0025B82819|nr:hypothetical protein [Mesorhizobium sp.]
MLPHDGIGLLSGDVKGAASVGTEAMHEHLDRRFDPAVCHLHFDSLALAIRSRQYAKSAQAYENQRQFTVPGPCISSIIYLMRLLDAAGCMDAAVPDFSLETSGFEISVRYCERVAVGSALDPSFERSGNRGIGATIPE